MVNTISENTNYFNKVKVVEKSFKERQSELIGRFYDEEYALESQSNLVQRRIYFGNEFKSFLYDDKVNKKDNKK